MAVDQLDSARQPCWSKQTCIHVYECPAILRLLLHFALGVSMDIVAEALAGAAFITSAVSVGFAPASGAVGAGTGFGATGKLEYSFCRSGPGRTSEETPQPRPALRPNLHRSSSHAPHSKTCRCNSVNVSGTKCNCCCRSCTAQDRVTKWRAGIQFCSSQGEQAVPQPTNFDHLTHSWLKLHDPVSGQSGGWRCCCCCCRLRGKRGIQSVQKAWHNCERRQASTTRLEKRL